MTIIDNSTSALWADIKAAERFPFAAAANRYEHSRARQSFVNRARDNSQCAYSALRKLHAGAPERL
jgi:hypothetical protein